MKNKNFLIFLCLFVLFGCSKKAGPTIHYYKKDGVQWYTSKIYTQINGKKKLAQIDDYKNGHLQERKVYHELWPNGEWKFVSEDGFYVFQKGKNLLLDDSLVVPDNIIYIYIDKSNEEHIEVYKDGKRIPYTFGYPDGHTVHKLTGENPGVYSWKDGKEYFVRAFTDEELENHKKINDALNKK
jgi:hypothetical protein